MLTSGYNVAQSSRSTSNQRPPSSGNNVRSTDSSSMLHRVPFVPETAFGVWFLRTHTWEHHVLRVAINDLKRLIDAPLPAAPTIVDVGCGQGISFRLLAQTFKPARIVGLDFHEPSLDLAKQAANACRHH